MARRTTMLLLALWWCGVTPTLQEAQPPAADQAPLTFRVEANFVEVDALVSDTAGNPVRGLRAEDFQLFEDGKPQTVRVFSYVDIPVMRPNRPLLAPTAIEPDVQTNVGLDGRIYLIVLDDLHVDFTRAARVKQALGGFLDRDFGANDLGAVVFTSGRASDAQDFTNNARLLRAAVDRFTGTKLRSSTLERLEELNRLQTDGLRQAGDPIRDPLALERGHRARNAMDSLRKLADFMAGVHGRRKAMVLVSEGIDYDIQNLFDNNGFASDVIDATRQAIASATRSNVSIYTVDPRGLSTADADLIGAPGVLVDDPGLTLGVPSALDELRQSQNSLRTLAEETGGVAFLNQNDFTGAFDRLVRDNSSYYVLGYYPSNDRRDGRFRKVEVRVAGTGLTVRARRGYVAPRGRATPSPQPGSPRDDALRAAVESPLPIGGIPMRLFAAPFKGTPPNAAVALALDLSVDGFTFARQARTLDDTLDVVVRVIDPDGKVRINEKATVDLTLMPETLARAKASGFRLTTSISLPPGRYQLRVAAAETGGAAGSVATDLDVPDFYKAPFLLSGVVLTSALASQQPTARIKDDPVGVLLMQPPVARREFDREDELTLFAEVYENQPSSPTHSVDISTELRADGGRVVFENRESRSSTELQGGRGGYGYAVRVPLRDLAAGVYVLRVTAAPRAAGSGTSVYRDIQITLR